MSEGKVAEQYYLAVLVSSETTYVKHISNDRKPVKLSN